ncbi:hypothetical protein SA21204_1339 [Staphylococcus aureus subsp. aureus 21204]|nr:hypothetical protein SA21204_1339 [Staphylococcus aureus subsp. aureus 21204]
MLSRKSIYEEASNAFYIVRDYILYFLLFFVVLIVGSIISDYVQNYNS